MEPVVLELPCISRYDLEVSKELVLWNRIDQCSSDQTKTITSCLQWFLVDKLLMSI